MGEGGRSSLCQLQFWVFWDDFSFCLKLIFELYSCHFHNIGSVLNILIQGNKDATELCFRTKGTLTVFESALQNPRTPRICHGLTRLTGQRASSPNNPWYSAALCPPCRLAAHSVCCSLPGKCFSFFLVFFFLHLVGDILKIVSRHLTLKTQSLQHGSAPKSNSNTSQWSHPSPLALKQTRPTKGWRQILLHPHTKYF